MNNSNEPKWADSVWTEIDTAVLTEVGKVRIAQKVFPAMGLNDNSTEVPNEVINFKDLSIAEGKTKPFVEIFQEFSLTSTQVKKESDSSKICQILARMAAKAIALAEDTIIFQGDGKLPANVQADQVDSAGKGLLGEANPGDADNADKASRYSEQATGEYREYAEIGQAYDEYRGGYDAVVAYRYHVW